MAEPVHDNPGYAIVGSGFVTGGILLLRLLGYTTELELGLLTTFVLDTVSEVDTAVGSFVGESYLMRIDEKEEKKELILGPLKDEALIEFKEKSVKRKDLLRKIWHLCDQFGEMKVEEVISSLSNGESKESK